MVRVESAKQEMQRMKDRMIQLIERTPDDRLFWKPSATSRSIGEIAAHSAQALEHIAIQIQGIPFPIPTSSEANVTFLDHDQSFTNRDEVVGYLNEKCCLYQDCLDSLAATDLDRMAVLPFGLGEAPVGIFIAAGPQHTLGHIAQIEYIQTMYGDMDWHTGF